MATTKAKKPAAKKSTPKKSSAKKSVHTSSRVSAATRDEYTQTTKVLIVIWLALIAVFVVSVIAKMG